MKGCAQILGFLMAAVVGALVLAPLGAVGFLVGLVVGPVLYLMAWGWILLGAESREAAGTSDAPGNVSTS